MPPIVNVSEEDQATDIGNMRKKFGEDRLQSSRDILTDSQGHRQTYSSQYFAAAPVGKVITDSNHVLLTCGCDRQV